MVAHGAYEGNPEDAARRLRVLKRWGFDRRRGRRGSVTGGGAGIGATAGGTAAGWSASSDLDAGGVAAVTGVVDDLSACLLSSETKRFVMGESVRRWNAEAVKGVATAVKAAVGEASRSGFGQRGGGRI